MIKKDVRLTTKGNGISYVVLTIVSLFSVFPLAWMVISATNKSVDVTRGVLIPGTAFLDNLKKLLAAQALGTAMANSFKYAIILTVVSLLICSLAGYAFEIYHDKGKDFVMKIILLAMMVPFVAVLIPLFQMMSAAKLLNTTAAFILPSISTPLLIMLFRQSSRSFPRDIIEAARIDGLKEYQIFLRMFVPTQKSTYAAALTITFMAAWNAYLWPIVVMSDKKSITMPMLVANTIQGYVTDYGVVMVGVLFCTLPTVIIFFIIQKNFAEGITGSIK